MSKWSPFLGHCSLKQYVKNKLRSVGLEIFVICYSSRIMIDFEIYNWENHSTKREERGSRSCIHDETDWNFAPGNFCLFQQIFYNSIARGRTEKRDWSKRYHSAKLHERHKIEIRKIWKERVPWICLFWWCYCSSWVERQSKSSFSFHMC